MMTAQSMFRRRKSSDTWHWRAECSNYPRAAFVGQRFKPTTGELCDECKAKQKDKDDRKESLP
jgi:hypothetical protein